MPKRMGKPRPLSKQQVRATAPAYKVDLSGMRHNETYQAQRISDSRHQGAPLSRSESRLPASPGSSLGRIFRGNDPPAAMFWGS